MPEAAKAHTKAGAKAFVVYFWEVADYAQATLDPAPVRRLVSTGCGPCEDAIGFIEKVRSSNGRITGGTATVSDLRVGLWHAGGAKVAQVDFFVTSTDQIVDYPADKPDEHYPAATVRDRFTLSLVDGGWQVAGWQVLG